MPFTIDTLLCFATLKEAQFSIEKLGATLSCVDFFIAESVGILITGVGSMAAATSLSFALAKYKPQSVLNLGIAGLFGDHLPIGAMQKIKSVAKHLSLPPTLDDHSRLFARNCFPIISLAKTEGALLLTSDYPIHSRPSELLQHQLVDMEGYGIAYACKALNTPCQMVKIISDLTRFDGPKSIKRHLNFLSEEMASWLDFLLPAIGAAHL